MPEVEEVSDETCDLLLNDDITVSDLVNVSYEVSLCHGFWDVPSVFVETDDIDVLQFLYTTRLALIGTEVSEAIENLRKIKEDESIAECIAEELADIVIRVADLAGNLEIPLESVIIEKTKKNILRGYKHGKGF